MVLRGHDPVSEDRDENNKVFSTDSDVRSVIRIVKHSSSAASSPYETHFDSFDPASQWNYKVSDDPLSPAIFGILGGLRLKHRMELYGCDESVLRTCLLVQSAVQQATASASACLLFYHEKTDKLRTFISGPYNGTSGFSRYATRDPLGGGSSAQGVAPYLSPSDLPKPPTLEVPRSPMLETRRKFSTAPIPASEWQLGLLYHFHASQSIPGVIFQALQSSLQQARSKMLPGDAALSQPLAPFVWVRLPHAPWKPPSFSSVRSPINSLFPEVLWSRYSSSTERDRCLFILIKAPNADYGGKSLGLLALRDPLMSVPRSMQPAMIRYLAHIDTDFSRVYLEDESIEQYTPKAAGEAACFCLCQGICLWLNLSLHTSLRSDAYKAEILKREFLLSLTQYVCKVGKVVR